jgi:hypothetical protein
MNHSTYLTAWQAAIRRRAFLKDSVSGLGGIALAGLLDPSLFSTAGRAADTAKPADRWRGVLNPPHRPVKARRVIHLCMALDRRSSKASITSLDSRGSGRDHHILGFSIWMAGGGIKRGVTYGATDELGHRAVDNVLHVRDLHATILHLCGIDHTRLSYKFQGLDVRLIGVEPARVVSELLA